MKRPAARVSRRYAAMLGRFLARRQESLLERAYGLGRNAIAQGLGILDMARIHQEALAHIFMEASTAEKRRPALRAAEVFFLQTLSPFEAAHRGFQGMNAELLKRNRDLEAEILERRRVEKALRLSEERFRLLVANVKDYAIILVDREGRVASWNAGAERTNGWRESEIAGRQFSCFYPAADIAAGKPRHDLELARRQGRFEDEGWRVRKDGSRFWASVVITPVRDSSGRVRWFAHVTRDMTERKHIEESLQNLSSRILHAQEEERRRISRELHDEVGQFLTAVSISLAALKNHSKLKTGPTAKKIASAQRLLAATMRTVHRFARELRPAMLDELGLLPALRSHVRTFASRSGLHVRFSGNPAAEMLNDEQKTALFRIAQESLTNVAKHAHASRVSVVVRQTSEGICLEVADNGKAFRLASTKTARKKHQLGLLGMQERVRLVNGRFSIRPELGRGTIVRAMIPLPSAGKRE